jgi:hypothetical protein
MQPSPIQLTPEQAQHAFEKKREAFLTDFKKLEEKHGLTISARLVSSNAALLAVPQVVPVEKAQQTDAPVKSN